jgi:hypothetical protein
VWRSKGRSGIGNQFLDNSVTEGKDHTWEGWAGLSPNGRQYKSEMTEQVNNLSGADYWHMRKELPNKLDCASVIKPEDYKTPSYYHAKRIKIEKQDEIVVDKEEKEVHITHVVKEKSIFLELSEDNIFRKIYLKLKGE